NSIESSSCTRSQASPVTESEADDAEISATWTAPSRVRDPAPDTTAERAQHGRAPLARCTLIDSLRCQFARSRRSQDSGVERLREHGFRNHSPPGQRLEFVEVISLRR